MLWAILAVSMLALLLAWDARRDAKVARLYLEDMLNRLHSMQTNGVPNLADVSLEMRQLRAKMRGEPQPPSTNA